MKDIIYVNLTGYEEKEDTNAIQRLLVNSVQRKVPVDILSICKLTPPLQTNHAALLKLSARGVLSINGNTFTNNYPQSTVVHLYDQALGDFTLEVPAKLIGTASVLSSNITINLLSCEVKMELSYIAQLGLDRSMFQRVSSIFMSEKLFTVKLLDDLDKNKEIVVQIKLDKSVSLSEGNKSFITLLNKVKSDESDPCDVLNPEQAPFYVYRRNDGMCQIYGKDFGQGGSIVWTAISPGFQTKGEADAYYQQCLRDGRCSF